MAVIRAERRWAKAVPCGAAFAALVWLGVGKLCVPYRQAYDWPIWAYYGAAVGELMVAIALVFWRVLAAWVILVGGIVAILVTLAVKGDYG